MSLPEEREILKPVEGKLIEMGTIILQSKPCSKEEGDAWLKFIAAHLPSEVFTTYSWIPIQG